MNMTGAGGSCFGDFEGFPCRYQYDGSRDIVDIEDALHGHYVMAYGPRNQRILERNQDEKEVALHLWWNCSG